MRTGAPLAGGSGRTVKIGHLRCAPGDGITDRAPVRCGGAEHRTCSRSIKRASKRTSPEMTEPSDESLMSLFQQGNEPAYALLVQRYKDELTNFSRRFLGDRDEADDVVQETFVRVWRSRGSYTPAARFSTWIYTIASNLAKTRLRRWSLRRFVRLGEPHGDGQMFDLPDESAGPDGAADDTLREERIQQALKS